MQILSKDYIFTGKHAMMVDEMKRQGFFEYLWQILVSAPLLGFIYKRKGSNDTNSGIKPTTIFLGQITPRKDWIMFIYKLILLADSNNEGSPDERIKKAFLNIDTAAAEPDEQLFNAYLLGGVELLYEKLFNKKNNDMINEEEDIDTNIPTDILFNTSMEHLENFIEDISIAENDSEITM